jgi:hypothetical protein
MASKDPKLDLTVRGSTGLPVWHGRVYDEPLRELEGERGRKVYREMSEQDPIIGGTLLGIEMLARQVQWTIQPAEFPEEDDQGEIDPVTGLPIDPAIDPVTGKPLPAPIDPATGKPKLPQNGQNGPNGQNGGLPANGQFAQPPVVAGRPIIPGQQPVAGQPVAGQPLNVPTGVVGPNGPNGAGQGQGQGFPPGLAGPMPPPAPKKPVLSPDEEIAQEVATFIDQCLTDMRPSWGATLSEILSMLVYGWSWLEIIYKRREGMKVGNTVGSSLFEDGKIGWSGWHIRGQDTHWRWLYQDDDPDKELIGMEQLAPPHYKQQEIPRWKSLHFTTKSRLQNPEGVSLLRNAYRSWYMKKNIEVIEGIGIERDLAGLPVLWAPAELFSATADEEQKTLLVHLQKIVTSIKRDEQEGILMPMAFDEEGKNPLYKLELLNTGGDRQFDTNAIIQRYDERIAMSMMADFLLMGHTTGGSYSLSTTKTNLFSNALSAILDVLIEEINLQAIPQLVLLNGWDLKYCPSLIHGKIEANDLRAVGEYLRQLNAAGMPLFPNKALEIYLLEAAGLPSDPGAGDMPYEQEGGMENEFLLDPEAANPMVDVATAQAKLTKAQAKTTNQQAKTGADGDLGDKPNANPLRGPNGGGRGAPPIPVHNSSIQKRPQNVALAQQQRATLRQPKRYAPLGARLVRASEVLREMLDPGDYQDLVMRAMETRQFSALSAEDQALIRQAEAELIKV